MQIELLEPLDLTFEHFNAQCWVGKSIVPGTIILRATVVVVEEPGIEKGKFVFDRSSVLCRLGLESAAGPKYKESNVILDDWEIEIFGSHDGTQGSLRAPVHVDEYSVLKFMAFDCRDKKIPFNFGLIRAYVECAVP